MRFLLFQEALIKSIYVQFTNFGTSVIYLTIMQNEIKATIGIKKRSVLRLQN